jgi:hypothetical protein
MTNGSLQTVRANGVRPTSEDFSAGSLARTAREDMLHERNNISDIQRCQIEHVITKAVIEKADANRRT